MPNKLPTPFSKPSISLATHGKAWKDIEAYKLRVGDIVRDHGAVETTGPSGVADTTVKFLSGEVVYFAGTERVHAFTTAE